MKVVASQKHNYTIIRTVEAGMILQGTEIKAVANSQVNLAGSYVTIANNEAYANNIKIRALETPYFKPNSGRQIKLLLNKSEIRELRSEKVIIPVAIYFSGNKAKLQIAVVSPMRKEDKRQRELKKIHTKEIRDN